MVWVKSAGATVLVMKENGFIIFVTAMVFLKQKINKSIEASGSMICDTEKVNGSNQTVVSFMETLGMIDVMVCVPINKQVKSIRSLLSTKMA